MIIFDLDGSLADCTHRRHYVDPADSVNYILKGYDGNGKMVEESAVYCNIIDGKRFKPNWDKFHEECDKDLPIKPVIACLNALIENEIIQIWSGRCESVREKTIKWIKCNVFNDDESTQYIDRSLKMRPIGDYTPDNELKERWLDESLAQGNTIDFVVDDRKKVVEMWRRRGIFVFDVNQTGKDF